MNSVVLIGRLTRDPEVRMAGEQKVANFTLAIDRPPRRDGNKETDFPRITVFGKQAENCEKHLAKGRLVGVEGRIQTGSYTNRNGDKVYTTDVLATRVEFLEWGDKNEQAPAPREPQPAPAPAPTPTPAPAPQPAESAPTQPAQAAPDTSQWQDVDDEWY